MLALTDPEYGFGNNHYLQFRRRFVILSLYNEYHVIMCHQETNHYVVYIFCKWWQFSLYIIYGKCISWDFVHLVMSLSLLLKPPVSTFHNIASIIILCILNIWEYETYFTCPNIKRYNLKKLSHQPRSQGCSFPTLSIQIHVLPSWRS